MGPIDALVHLLSLFAPALGLAALASGLAKLLWRRELRGHAWWRLFAWGAGAGAIATVVGLVAYGQDGRVGTYAGIVVACTTALWWSAFARRRGG